MNDLLQTADGVVVAEVFCSGMFQLEKKWEE